MRNTRLSILSLCFLLIQASLPAQDVIMQGFYWNTHPGDVTQNNTGGIWWDTLATVAPQLRAAGFQTIWIPPPSKGFGNLWDMGYGLYDYYDLGQHNQKGSIRTRFGNRAQFLNMVAAIKNQNLRVMVDAVLNHRGGGDGQQNYQVPWNPQQGWVTFNPASGRFPGNASHFHPNNYHPDQNADYRNPLFFEDICYFNGIDAVPPQGGWYFGAPNTPGMGVAGDSLIVWGRWLMNTLGCDELRLDAIKHIDPYFLAKFLVETKNGPQPFAVGEFYDYNSGPIVNYHNLVRTSPNSGNKSANLSVFDFPFRKTLQDICNDGSGSQDLYQKIPGGNLVWGAGMSGFDVVTWVENHDTDRTGISGSASPCQFTYGSACLRYTTESDHNPVVQDKEDMAYPLLMASEGRPSVFWKDWFWFNLKDHIRWQMALRSSTATGTSAHIQNMNGFWPNAAPYDGDNHGGNMFAMRRNGLSSGVSDGMVLGLNDHPSKTNGVWVNTSFSNKYLRDYSDAFMFEYVQAFNDSRAFIKAKARDYSWWSLTGLYPRPPGFTPPWFQLAAQPGGCPHYVVLDIADAGNFLVNGGPLAAGDQIAITNAGGLAMGIGRVGQQLSWNGSQDMVIEVLGAFPTNANPTGGPANGMGNGAAFSLQVYDASAGNAFRASALQFAPINTPIVFNPLRPASPGRTGAINLNVSALGNYSCGSISRITALNADIPVSGNLDLRVVKLEANASGSRALLRWDIEGTEQPSGFEVELADEQALNFNLIGTVAAGAGKSYQFLSGELAAGRHLFRVRVLEPGGGFHYSPVAELFIETHSILEVPHSWQNGEMAFDYTGSPCELRIVLTDLSGRIAHEESLLHPGGNASYHKALNKSGAGIYVLRVSNGQRQWVQKVLR